MNPARNIQGSSYEAQVNRWEWVDHAKGIGIVLVVYGHVARGLLNAGLSVNKILFSTIDTIIYSFHMSLFFFLAGLFVFHSLQKRGAALFIANKIDIILYPYIIWSLVQGVIEVFLGPYTNHHIKWGAILSLWIPRAQFWFLYSLMLMFILSAILFKLFKKERSFIVSLLVIGIAIVFIPGIKQVWGLQNITPLIYFALGCAAASNLQWRIIISDKIFLIFSIVAFIIIEFILCSLQNHFTYGTISIRLIAAISGIFLCLKIESFTVGHIRDILVRLGKASMFIYVAHIIIASGLRIILQKVFKVDNVILHVSLGTLAGLMIPFFLFEIYGKRQWLRGLWRAPEIFSIEKKAIAMSAERNSSCYFPKI